jgi:transcriptional regulator with XRE-family HTH domain
MAKEYRTVDSLETITQIQKLLDSGLTVEYIARQAKLSKQTIRRIAIGDANQKIRLSTRNKIHILYETERQAGTVQETAQEIINHFRDRDDELGYDDDAEYSLKDFTYDTLISNQIRILNEIKEFIEIFKTQLFLSLGFAIIIVALLVISLIK